MAEQSRIPRVGSPWITAMRSVWTGQLLAQSLSCHQDDTCADGKCCTECVEDRGAHAAGGRKFSTCLVDNHDRGSSKFFDSYENSRTTCCLLGNNLSICIKISGSGSWGFPSLYCGYGNRSCQLVIFLRSLSLSNGVIASLNPLTMITPSAGVVSSFTRPSPAVVPA